MRTPFTIEQFLNVFEDYNQAIWPVQFVAYGLGAIAIGATLTRQSRIANGVLGLLWIWNGLVYHLFFFRQINPAAVVFAALFVVQGILFLFAALRPPIIGYRISRDAWFWIGMAAVFYSMVLYPVLGFCSGHVYPRSPVFGVAPCPTTIFTIGLLLIAVPSLQGYLVPIPVLWSVVGAAAAMQLGVREDLMLPLSGLTLLAFRLWGGRGSRQVSSAPMAPAR